MSEFFTYVAAGLAVFLLAALGLRDLIGTRHSRRGKRLYGTMIWLCALALFVLIWFNPEYWPSTSVLFTENAQ